MIKEIGGYFSLEINASNEEYHDTLSLNTARNAFEYIILANHYRKVFIPYYFCDVLLEPLIRNNIEYEFYQLSNTLDIKENINLTEKEALLYINYFGIKNQTVIELSAKYKNLIIDNSQSFYSLPVKNIDTFYSPRKFFGVPDGAYLYTTHKLNKRLRKDESFDRISHLISRIEKPASLGYQLFIENEKKINNQEIKRMSSFTKKILKNINYEKIRDIRKENFNFLHENLKHINELNVAIQNENIDVPMVYPFLKKENKHLRIKLIKQKIYIPTYWNNVFDFVEENDFEFYLTENLLALPIDQRYGEKEMTNILSLINL